MNKIRSIIFCFTLVLSHSDDGISLQLKNSSQGYHSIVRKRSNDVSFHDISDSNLLYLFIDNDIVYNEDDLNFKRKKNCELPTEYNFTNQYIGHRLAIRALSKEIQYIHFNKLLFSDYLSLNVLRI